MNPRVNPLCDFLDQLESRYHRQEFLTSDPLEFVHHYRDPHDQEAVALLAALLAYGNVKQIRRSVTGALERMERLGGSPSGFVRKLGGLGKEGGFGTRARKEFSDWVHRFNTGDDLVLLMTLLAESWARHGSLGSHFNGLLAPEDEDFGRALSALIAEWRAWASGSGKPSFGYFLTSPADGSCCKRWCMFLRWMGRKDASGQMDPGLWTEQGGLAGTFGPGARIAARQLVMPLDTHTSRISRYIGLTSRKSTDWKTALEVTASLRRCAPSDPIRYDFALARLGILDLCQGKYRHGVCEGCELFGICNLARVGSRAEARKAARKGKRAA